MFYSRYPSEWEPEFDNHGNVINDIEPVRPEATIFLKSSLQGDFLKDKGTMKQVSLRIPESMFYDIEALAEVGSVAPHTGAWIETNWRAKGGHVYLSHPTRVRGLKRFMC